MMKDINKARRTVKISPGTVKAWKRAGNRRFRRESKLALRNGGSPPHSLCQTSNTWDLW